MQRNDWQPRQGERLSPILLSCRTIAFAGRPAAAAGTALLALLLAAELCFHAWLIPRATYDPDEFFTVGVAWRIGQGQLPTVDFFEPRPSLLFKLYAAPLAALGERADIIDLFRWFHGGLALLLCGLLFAFHRRAFDAKTALWALCLQNSLPFFVRATIHVRPDAPALILALAAALALAGAKDGPLGRSRAALAAVLFGLAAAVNITIPFLAVGAAAWVFLVKTRDSGAVAGLKAAVLFGVVAAATFLATYFVVFGVNAPAVWIPNARAFAFVRAYLGGLPNDSWLKVRRLLAENPLSWALIGAGLVYGHARWATVRRDRRPEALALLLADGGLLFVLVHDHLYPQHFLLLTIFAAGVAAAAVRDWAALAERRLRAAAAPMVALAMIVVFAAAALIAGRTDLAAMRERDAERPPVLAAAGVAMPGEFAWVEPEALQRWLKKAPDFRKPFTYRSRARRAAQFQFVLANSRPGDVVYSDWLNPPYRDLPGAVEHGLMLPLIETSAALRDDPGLAELFRRYDPGYSPAEPRAEQVMMRLFATRRPALIVLDGSPAELFYESAEFRNWMSARYRFTFQPESGSVFALRNPAGR
jgi:hypothetical protein